MDHLQKKLKVQQEKEKGGKEDSEERLTMTKMNLESFLNILRFFPEWDLRFFNKKLLTLSKWFYKNFPRKFVFKEFCFKFGESNWNVLNTYYMEKIKIQGNYFRNYNKFLLRQAILLKHFTWDKGSGTGGDLKIFFLGQGNKKKRILPKLKSMTLLWDGSLGQIKFWEVMENIGYDRELTFDFLPRKPFRRTDVFFENMFKFKKLKQFMYHPNASRQLRTDTNVDTREKSWMQSLSRIAQLRTKCLKISLIEEAVFTIQHREQKGDRTWHWGLALAHAMRHNRNIRKLLVELNRGVFTQPDEDDDVNDKEVEDFFKIVVDKDNYMQMTEISFTGIDFKSFDEPDVHEKWVKKIYELQKKVSSLRRITLIGAEERNNNLSEETKSLLEYASDGVICQNEDEHWCVKVSLHQSEKFWNCHKFGDDDGKEKAPDIVVIEKLKKRLLPVQSAFGNYTVIPVDPQEKGMEVYDVEDYNKKKVFFNN